MENSRAERFTGSEEYFESVLREAKEENKLSAKRTLAELYHTARDERQSDAEAMRWYALAALQTMNEYAAQGDAESAQAAINALWELGDFQKEIKNYSGAENSYKRMEQLCLDLPEELRGRESERLLAVSCNKLGSLCERNGNAAKACEYYSRALEISERAAAAENTNEARDDLAVANYRLGFIEYLFSGKKARLDKAYEIWEQLYEETGNYEYRRRRSVIDTLYATAEVPSEQTQKQAPSAEEHPAAPGGNEQTESEFAAENDAPYTAEKGRKKRSGAVFAAVVAAIAVILAACIWLLLR